ncbi:DHA2 family efflux MFS transporter permease subunit [Streptomyces sp. CB03911]|uniref:DHA2 family efflux MFS transporter permease subunit n=1 Tax=Streptomycetaceae TaxID=2062 RepID=UPI00093A87A9|nr:DHA2 family efflux MFS transporter permease subunit [Streptomyces sp. CB03911]OKI20319.1 MFS transporter [Streptomyces sp. CB03911]
MVNEPGTTARPSFGLTVLAVSLPMFMVALDNLVVTNALTTIKEDLGTSVQGLQWITNSYILGFASLLLVAAGLGDRFGRRKVFVSGLSAFVVFSIGCALSSSAPVLITLRALQGMSAAAVLPLSLTMLTVAVPPEKRGVAIGIWSSISSLAVGIAPLVGGAITTGIGWHWLFWLNVPIGIVAVPLVLVVVSESRGAASRLDVVGLLLGSVGVLALIWAIVDSSDHGWTSGRVLGMFATAAVLLVLFVLWERRAPAPLLPLRIYRNRAFRLANLASLAVFFGLFGSIFFLAQYLQVSRHHSPFVAGLWTLPWAIMPTVVAPFAGKLIPRYGAARLIAAGLGLSAVGLAWCALGASADTPDWQLVLPFMLCGIGTGLIFAPTATVVVTSVQPQDIGKASGTNATVREIGSALGIAVLTTVFTSRGSYLTPQAFADGMTPGLWVCVVVLLAGAVLALGIPGQQPPAPAPVTAEKQTA